MINSYTSDWYLIEKEDLHVLVFHYLPSSFYFLTVFCSDEEEEKPKKEVVPLVFKNKREAMEAFKSLLKEKVCRLNHGALLFSLNKFIEGHD